MVNMLWKRDSEYQPTPAAHGSAARRHDTIDQRVGFLVLDEADEPSDTDRANPGILVLDMSKAKNANPQPGISTRYCMESVAPLEDRIRVRRLCCSCKHCKDGEGTECTYSRDMGEWKVVPCHEVPPQPVKVAAVRLPLTRDFLTAGGELPVLNVALVSVIVGVYGCNLVIVVGLPYTLDKAMTRQFKKATFSFKNNEEVLNVQPMRRADGAETGGAVIPPDQVPFVRDGTHTKPFLMKLAQVVLPQSVDDLNEAQLDLGITLLPPPHVGSPQVFLVPSTMLDKLRDAEQQQIALGD